MKYIDAERLKEMIKRFSTVEYSDGTLGDDVANAALDCVIEKIIPSLQQEQPKGDLENKFGWHNIPEESPEFGDTVIVACKNKNKEDGIWLYDLIQCWEGKWKPRENWETPLK